MLPLRFRFASGLALVAVALSSGYQPMRGDTPAAPAPPTEYKVQIRFRINAARNEHIQQFLAMTRYFESLGFQEDSDEEIDPADPAPTRMHGTIPSGNAHKLLDDSHVKAILLLPPAFKPGEDQPVKVQLELVAGFTGRGQLLLADEVRERLSRIGFRESIAYDHRGQTRLLGTIPGKELENLLKDLREAVPVKPPEQLPEPLRLVSPILATEVIDTTGVPPAKEPMLPPEPPKEQAYLLKIAPDLREGADQEGAGRPERLEIILAYAPDEGDRAWQQTLSRAVPNLVIEGQLGSLITVLASAKTAPALAQLPLVTVIRRPLPALPFLRTSQPGTGSAKASDVQNLHAQGYRGQHARIAVIDGDFRGYDAFIGKGLPRSTRYIDLTAERNPDLKPDEFPGNPKTVGPGTQSALAVAQAAPEADLFLIRIDPAAPHQLHSLGRLLRGDLFRTESYLQRDSELAAENERLRKARAELAQERQTILELYGRPDIYQRPEDLLRKPEEIEKEARDRLDALEKKGQALAAEEKIHLERQRLFLKFQTDIQLLKNVQIVTSSLVWTQGYPVNGGSPLSRFLSNPGLPPGGWFQAAGETRGQVWSGLFHDADGNGVMEFGPSQALRPGRWTTELNFLGWQAWSDKGELPELPAKTRIRLSLQWKEAHDPQLWNPRDDVYMAPLAQIRLLLLRQRDPSGKKLAADDLEVAALSSGMPQRLSNAPNSATYEQYIDFTVDTPGRFALRVEGRIPLGNRPGNVASLRGTEQMWEMWPRIMVEALDEPSRKKGRPVFLDYATDLGTLGIPAEARGVTTVIGVDRYGRPEPSSALGPPMKRELEIKPDRMSSDTPSIPVQGDAMVFGSALAAPFAAGKAALEMQALPPRAHVLGVPGVRRPGPSR
jgi:hypothetical protein